MQHQLFLSMTTLRVTALDLRLTTISHAQFFTWFAGLYELIVTRDQDLWL